MHSDGLLSQSVFDRTEVRYPLFLEIPRFEESCSLFMFQCPIKWDGNDFHIGMRMGAETGPSLNDIIIKHAQGAKVHTLWVHIACK